MYFFVYLLLIRQLSGRFQAKVCPDGGRRLGRRLTLPHLTRLLTFTAGCPPAFLSL